MKVIFLDVDGVLNDRHTMTRTTQGTMFVDRIHLQQVRLIVSVTGAQIVLSSDWRYDRYDPKYNQDFLELTDVLDRWNIPIFDCTPELHARCTRGQEIEAWLKDNPQVESFVILDDHSDMHPYMDRLVKTNMWIGLTDELTKEAIRVLEKTISGEDLI